MPRIRALAVAAALWLAAASPAVARELAGALGAGETLSLRDLFEAGGFLMWIILALSAAAVAAALYLSAVLRESSVAPRPLVARLLELLRSQKLDAAAGLVTSEGSPLARIARAGFRRFEAGPGGVRSAVEAAGRREVAHLRNAVGHLASIGAIAPMLGLLGTVIGLIQSYASIAADEVRVAPLAAGIVRAMVTTAFGLMVGILALAFYHYFRGRLVMVSSELEFVSEEMAALIEGSRPAPEIPEVTSVAEEIPAGSAQAAAASAPQAPAAGDVAGGAAGGSSAASGG